MKFLKGILMLFVLLVLVFWGPVIIPIAFVLSPAGVIMVISGFILMNQLRKYFFRKQISKGWTAIWIIIFLMSISRVFGI